MPGRAENSYNLLVVTGPTASGKTRLAARLALALGGEVISADSRQVYREMNLGTGKDYEDYHFGNRTVPYHLVDVVDAGQAYNVFEYQQDFLKVYNDLKSRKAFPVVCGGTGMYLEAILKGYKMTSVPVDKDFRSSLEGKTMEEMEAILASYRKLHNITDTVSRKRLIRALEIEKYQKEHPLKTGSYPDIRPLVVGVDIDRETRRRKITERLKKRLGCGMIAEVEALSAKGVRAEMLLYYGLEYKYIAMYLSGELNYREMFSKLETAIHRFAKRQMTWFRGMERRGIPIQWINYDLPEEEKVNTILGWLGRRSN